MKLKLTLKIFVLMPFLVAVPRVIGAETRDGQQTQGDRSVPAAVRPKILAQVLKDFPSLIECFEAEGQTRKEEYLANISIQEIDLNRDGRPEIFVEPSGGCDCGARNCPLWIYRQTTSGYSLFFESNGMGIGVEKTPTHGYLDILIESAGTAFTRFLTFYKFDGKEYREYKTDFINTETGEVKPASRRVQFPRGGTSATVSGKVSPGFGDTYLVNARAGQTMILSLTKAGRSISFMVISPGARESLIDRAKTWTGALPESGDYRVLVDGDEPGGTYTLSIAVR
jgi:hypothetical protein